MTLTEFLLERLAEREALAERTAATRWFTSHNLQGHLVYQHYTVASSDTMRRGAEAAGRIG